MSDVYVEDGEDQPYLVKEFENGRYEFPMSELFQRYQVDKEDVSDIVDYMDDTWDEDDIHVATEYWRRSEDNFYKVREAANTNSDDLWHEQLDSDRETSLESVEQELQYIAEHEDSPFSEDSVASGSDYVAMPVTEGEPDAFLRVKEMEQDIEIDYTVATKDSAVVTVENSESSDELKTVLYMAVDEIMENVDF